MKRLTSTHYSLGTAHHAPHPRWPLVLAAAIWPVACGDPQPPITCGTIPDQTLIVSEQVTVEPCFEDPEMGAITLSVESSDPEVVGAAVAGNMVRVQAAYPGTATVTITGTDPDMLTAQVSFGVVVPNRPPLSRGPLPEVIVPPGLEAQVLLSAHFTDPDGQELTYTAESSDAEVSSVEVTADTLSVTGLSLGGATVTVTATDPGGLSATSTAEVTVRAEPASLFRDDFDSDESLDQWFPADAEFEISEGRLQVTNLQLTGLIPYGFVWIDLAATDWEITASVANGTEGSWASLVVGTLHSRYPVLALQLGADPDGVFGAPSNYRLRALDVTLSGGPEFVPVPGTMGTSEAIKDVGELMEVSWVIRNDSISASVDGELLFSIEAGPYPTEVVQVGIGVRPATNAAGKIALFDWVEVSGVAGAGPGRQAPRPEAGLPGILRVLSKRR